MFGRMAAILKPRDQRVRQLRVDEEMKGQRFRSGGLHHGVAKRTGGVGEAGVDVFAHQIREIGEQLFDLVARRQALQNVGHANARAGDDRPPAADFRVDDDTFAHHTKVRGNTASVKITPPPLSRSPHPAPAAAVRGTAP